MILLTNNVSQSQFLALDVNFTCFDLLGEFPVLKSGEDVLTTSSKIINYLRKNVGTNL